MSRLTALLCASAFSVSSFAAGISNMQQTYNYLVGANVDGGALYTGTAGDLNGRQLPLSYYGGG